MFDRYLWNSVPSFIWQIELFLKRKAEFKDSLIFLNNQNFTLMHIISAIFLLFILFILFPVIIMLIEMANKRKERKIAHAYGNNAHLRLFFFWGGGVKSLLNVWGHITTMSTCSSDTLTNVLPQRNVMPQTKDTTLHPVTVYRHRADMSLCYPLMWNVTLEYTATHFNVLFAGVFFTSNIWQ